ncbi:MAG: CDP-glycerol glycerophosphotransferase family protein [Clostridia bacterium]|nr:CDP-glycerol glycerophosphotransferase family protein [Clostridia bacterium]
MTEEKYLFTIISAVYNAEKYIDELMASLIDQTIGFENIQVILVNDGSKDDSLSVCQKYQEAYPENVRVIDKENGGVSSARNAGLPYIEGKYLNFIDSDDKFSLDTLEKVYNYFEKYQDQTDVVNIPFEYFDGATGGKDHIQNKKFAYGSRLVNLENDYKVSIMNVTFSFMKSEACRDITFDTSICIGEDLKFINTVLLKKRTVALLNDGKYWYRKHSDGSPSLISTKLLLPQYYIPQVKNLTLWAYEYSMETYGDYPLFLQYTIASDFQEKIKPNNRAKSVLKDDIDEYRALVDKAMKTFSDKIITELDLLSKEYKVFWLSKKYDCPANATFYNGRVCYEFDCLDTLDEEGNPISKTKIDWYGYSVFDRIKLMDNGLLLSGYITVLPFENCEETIKIYIKAYNTTFEVKLQNSNDHCYYFDDEVIFYRYYYNVSIPYAHALKTTFTLAYGVDANTLSVPAHCGFDRYTPISNTAGGELYIQGNYALKPLKNGFSLETMPKKQIKKLYKKHLKYLKLKHKKHYLVRRTIDFLKKFFKKKIWLISDRFDIAGDNGEALFKYVSKNKPKGVKPYFVINEKSQDFDRMKKYGKVIKQGSKKHKIYYLLSDVNISAHLDYETLLPVKYDFYRDYICNKKVVFLQHGVTKDDIHTVYSRYKQNTGLFICASDLERDSIVQNEGYGFFKNDVKTTGFARFDYLENNDEKIITIMPTWRKYLVRGLDQNSKWIYISNIEETEFVKYYKELLSSEKLVEAAEKYGYKIHYVPHPNVMPLTDMLDVNPYISVISNPVYRDIFSHSSLMLTDYSSTAFDFAYMKKALVYAHFDSKLFFDSHTYSKGYFSYENDGFGEVVYDATSTIDTLIDYMKNGCQLKPIYEERIDKFFKYTDKNNCKRIVKSILEMEDYAKMQPIITPSKERIPVVLATNNAYAPFVSVTIESLLRNSDLYYYYDIFVFHTDLSRASIKALQAQTPNYSVRCIDVSKYINPHLKNLPKNSKYITKETYYRIVMPSVLSEYDKAVYIDCDLVVLGDISKFYSFDVSKHMVGGVRNPLHTIMKEHIEELGLNPLKYINAGVLLMNLDMMRKKGFENTCFELLATRDLRFMDQDAINLACENSIKYFDMSWNYGWHYERLNNFKDERYHLLESELEEYEQASECINILHYTGDVKPWKNSKYRFGTIFWDYAKRSPFYKDILYKSPVSPIYRKYLNATEEIENIKKSASYRIGRFITLPARAARRVLRKIKKIIKRK